MTTYTGTDLSLDPTTGDIIIQTTNSRSIKNYIQAVSKGEVLSTNSYLIDVEVCGTETIHEYANNPANTNFTFQRYSALDIVINTTLIIDSFYTSSPYLCQITSWRLKRSPT